MAEKEMIAPGERIRVLIVDDVKSARELLEDLLAMDGRFEVVAAVSDGLEAVGTALRLRPDLIVMDIRLPGLDGFSAVKRILAEFPVRIVMITASLGDEKEKLFQAFQSGALDVIDKQELYLWRTRPEIRHGFLRRMRALALTRVRQVRFPLDPEPAVLPSINQVHGDSAKLPLVVAIAASTGGPGALMSLLKRIPARINATFVVVQHMSRGFLDGLVKWLGAETNLIVRKADDGDLLQPGAVLFAPEDYHMQVTGSGSVRLNKALPINGHRPSAELLFDSLAQHYGRRGIGIILTGMGSDGASGLKRLRDSGGLTIAQNEESSIIFGMPRAAIELDAAEKILHLKEIAPQAVTWVAELNR